MSVGPIRKRTHGTYLAVWCFTISNYDPDREEKEFRMNQLIIHDFCKRYAKKFSYSLEEGSITVRLHYQGWISLNERKTPEQATVLFHRGMDCFQGGEIRISPAMGDGNEVFNRKYCEKGPTHVDGPWRDDTANEMLSRARKIITKEMLYPWQAAFADLVCLTPDDKTIYWVYEPVGGAGKSTLKDYLVKNKNFGSAGLMDHRKTMTWIYQNQSKFGFLFDLTRTPGKYADLPGLMQAAEDIKGGMIKKTEYKLEECELPLVQVVIFSNNLPKIGYLSAHRLKIYRVFKDSDNVDMSVIEEVDLREELEEAKLL